MVLNSTPTLAPRGILRPGLRLGPWTLVRRLETAVNNPKWAALCGGCGQEREVFPHEVLKRMRKAGDEKAKGFPRGCYSCAGRARSGRTCSDCRAPSGSSRRCPSCEAAVRARRLRRAAQLVRVVASEGRDVGSLALGLESLAATLSRPAVLA